jgi:hypothetical protein
MDPEGIEHEDASEEKAAAEVTDVTVTIERGERVEEIRVASVGHLNVAVDIAPEPRGGSAGNPTKGGRPRQFRDPQQSDAAGDPTKGGRV